MFLFVLQNLKNSNFYKNLNNKKIYKILENEKYILYISQEEDIILNYNSLLIINLINRKILKNSKDIKLLEFVDNYFISLSTLCRKI